jgi:hypothetical protein
MHFPSAYWEKWHSAEPYALFFQTPSIIFGVVNFMDPFSVSAVLIHFCMLCLQISLLALLYGIPLLGMARLFFLQFFLA